MKYKVVIVEWVDANYEDGSVGVDELEPLVTLKNVGWLVREDKESISLAMELCEEDETVRHVSHIPRSGIMRITEVKEMGKSRKSN